MGDAHAAPLFDINDQPLSAFLQLGRARNGPQGRLRIGAGTQHGERVKLRGSIAGLDPDTALSAVLSTTQLRRYQTNDEIGIALATD